MNSFGMVSAPFAFNLIDVQDLCRICGNLNNTFTSIFEDEGTVLDISSKINEYLPITVQKTDFLPLKICSVCAHTLLGFHEMYISCQTTNERFLSMLGCDQHDPTYGYDGSKQITNDPTDLLELQSSFSREIENEILQMHNSKYIENEIAADEAATELERIGGSFGDGSLVGANENGDAIDRDMNGIVLISTVTSVEPSNESGNQVNGSSKPANNSRVKTAEELPKRKDSNAVLNDNKAQDMAVIEKPPPDSVTLPVKTEKENRVHDKLNFSEPQTTDQKQLKEVNGDLNKAKSKNEVSKYKKLPVLKSNEKSVKNNKKNSTKVKPMNDPTNTETNVEQTANEEDNVKSTEEPHQELFELPSEQHKLTKQPDVAKVMECDYCLEEFKTKNKLVEHLKDSHNDKIFLCEMCNEYVAIADLMAHMLNHALQVNSTAETTFVTTITTTTTAAAEVEKPKDTDAEETESFIKVEPELMAIPIQNNNDSSCKENTQPKSLKAPVTCPECNRQFADRTGLRYHTNHFHNKLKNYICDLCHRSFSCKRIITNHILGIHLKEKRFKCEQCPKKFSTDSALYMHRKVHSDVLLFTCQVCERKFRSLTKLKVHITTHTKEKNYFCDICNKGFAIRNNLTKHMHTHSKSFDFKCHQCDYAANQRRYLFEHIKRSHKT